ncbi:MAG: DNA primase, partial [Muribaculaceae bacterium]|nr:DNA primase [Muribaculaceae bacterium]
MIENSDYMPRIDQETVNKILDTADIVDVVSDFVKLRRSGANFKGLCPFHNERTPSFSVNRARNICKCFSCGKGGSPVNFIMEHEQLSYQEALRYLARKYNIEIVEKELSDQEREAMNTREAMLAVNEFALTHFKKNLLESDEGRDTALAYLRHRGISDAMIARFHLGYAIDKSRELIDAAKSSGFNTKYLVDTGLAIERDDKSLYDRFRSRVIFPVHSIS